MGTNGSNGHNGHNGHQNGNGHNGNGANGSNGSSEPNGDKPRKKHTRRPTEEQNKIIEQIRGMIRINFTTGDIKRAVNKNYGIGYRQIMKYIALARARMVEATGVPENVRLARSIGYWSRKQQEAEQRITDSSAAMLECEEEIESAKVIMESPNASKEAYAAAKYRLETATRRYASRRSALNRAEERSADCQIRLDGLNGLEVVRKTAFTTADGRDIFKPVSEPLTPESANAELRSLYEQVRARKALDVSPSQN